MAWYIGLMSGTSLDGVDGVLAWAPDRATIEARFHSHQLFASDLRGELLALNRSGSDELHRAALATNRLMAAYGEVTRSLLTKSGLAATDIAAIGAHGQTVRHRPQEFDGLGYTLQLMNGALLAEHTGIDVVCDFRNRDVAAGGQGAPLVPAFHASCFAKPGSWVGVLNLGGIANLTLLGPASGEVTGFDCGPGNLLLDLWCQRHLGRPFDEDGQWASGGLVDADLLLQLMSEPFVSQAPPKSTGRDLFNDGWLSRQLTGRQVAPRNVMATLAEFTVQSAVVPLRRLAPACSQLLVCGGGAFNQHLMKRLGLLLGPQTAVSSTASAGIPPDQVEALAFAWLARQHLMRWAGNLPVVTGAAGPRVLGALHPRG